MALGLNSQHNQFVFSFPIDFVPKDIQDKYKGHLTNTHSVYDDVVDYMNSTILSINFPGLTFPVSTQTHKFGKEIAYRAAQAPYDTYDREFTVKIESIDNHANYFMMQDILMFHYINTQALFVDPMTIIILDQNRDEQWRYELREIVFTKISPIEFGYQNAKQDLATFTVGFRCNFIDNVYVPDLKFPTLVKTKL